jgi:hypothetical protein
MSEVFLICNQSGHFWGKSKVWVDGSDARAVMRVKNRDEASNTLFELSSKDFELRGDVITAQLNPKGNPTVEVSHIPLPVAAQEEDVEMEEDVQIEETEPESDNIEQPSP